MYGNNENIYGGSFEKNALRGQIVLKPTTQSKLKFKYVIGKTHFVIRWNYRKKIVTDA